MPQGISGLFGATGPGATSSLAVPSGGTATLSDPAKPFSEVLDDTTSGNRADAAEQSDAPPSAAETSGSSKSASRPVTKRAGRAENASLAKKANRVGREGDEQEEKPVQAKASQQSPQPAANAADPTPAQPEDRQSKPEPKKKQDDADEEQVTASVSSTAAQPTVAQKTTASDAPSNTPQASVQQAVPQNAQPNAAPARGSGRPARAQKGDDREVDAASSSDHKNASAAAVAAGRKADSQNDDEATADAEPDEDSAGTPQKLAIQPGRSVNPTADPSQVNADAAAAAAAQSNPSPTPDAQTSGGGDDGSDTVAPIGGRRAAKDASDGLLAATLGANVITAQSASTASAKSVTAAAAADAAPAASPTDQFADANHSKIVDGIQGRLLPNGGAMQIRLDPPELGAMQVRVEMRNGVMTASFETSNDQATKLLSHSLGELKTALESQGVSVEKLHVSQSRQQQKGSPDGSDSQKDASQPRQDTAKQQEQQRREMMQRMWRRLMKGQDPLDLVA